MRETTMDMEKAKEAEAEKEKEAKEKERRRRRRTGYPFWLCCCVYGLIVWVAFIIVFALTRQMPTTPSAPPTSAPAPTTPAPPVACTCVDQIRMNASVTNDECRSNGGVLVVSAEATCTDTRPVECGDVDVLVSFVLLNASGAFTGLDSAFTNASIAGCVASSDLLECALTSTPQTSTAFTIELGSVETTGTALTLAVDKASVSTDVCQTLTEFPPAVGQTCPVLGACCVGDNVRTCVEETREACEARTGPNTAFFWGDDTTCADVSCTRACACEDVTVDAGMLGQVLCVDGGSREGDGHAIVVSLLEVTDARDESVCGEQLYRLEFGWGNDDDGLFPIVTLSATTVNCSIASLSTVVCFFASTPPMFTSQVVVATVVAPVAATVGVVVVNFADATADGVPRAPPCLEDMFFSDSARVAPSCLTNGSCRNQIDAECPVAPSAQNCSTLGVANGGVCHLGALALPPPPSSSVTCVTAIADGLVCTCNAACACVGGSGDEHECAPPPTSPPTPAPTTDVACAPNCPVGIGETELLPCTNDGICVPIIGCALRNNFVCPTNVSPCPSGQPCVCPSACACRVNTSGAVLQSRECTLLGAGACCLTGTCRSFVDEDSCVAAGGVYRGDGSTCLNTTCPTPPPTPAPLCGTCPVDESIGEILFLPCGSTDLGTCSGVNTCIGAGSATCPSPDCIVGNEFSCDCDCACTVRPAPMQAPVLRNCILPPTPAPTPPPPTEGACCLEDGACVAAEEEILCNAPGSVFQGIGSTCLNTTCPTPPPTPAPTIGCIDLFCPAIPELEPVISPCTPNGMCVANQCVRNLVFNPAEVCSTAPCVGTGACACDECKCVVAPGASKTCVSPPTPPPTPAPTVACARKICEVNDGDVIVVNCTTVGVCDTESGVCFLGDFSCEASCSSPGPCACPTCACAGDSAVAEPFLRPCVPAPTGACCATTGLINACFESTTAAECTAIGQAPYISGTFTVAGTCASIVGSCPQSDAGGGCCVLSQALSSCSNDVNSATCTGAGGTHTSGGACETSGACMPAPPCYCVGAIAATVGDTILLCTPDNTNLLFLFNLAYADARDVECEALEVLVESSLVFANGSRAPLNANATVVPANCTVLADSIECALASVAGSNLVFAGLVLATTVVDGTPLSTTAGVRPEAGGTACQADAPSGTTSTAMCMTAPTPTPTSAPTATPTAPPTPAPTVAFAGSCCLRQVSAGDLIVRCVQPAPDQSACAIEAARLVDDYLALFGVIEGFSATYSSSPCDAGQCPIAATGCCEFGARCGDEVNEAWCNVRGAFTSTFVCCENGDCAVNAGAC